MLNLDMELEDPLLERLEQALLQEWDQACIPHLCNLLLEVMVLDLMDLDFLQLFHLIIIKNFVKYFYDN